jgi:hypothetical protein
VLSPNYSTASNKIYEELIVNVVIRHYIYSYVKNIVNATKCQAWPEHSVCSYLIEFTTLICTHLKLGQASSVE